MEAKSVVFELFTRIVLKYEIASEPFKRPPMRLDVLPYAAVALAPVKRTSGYG
jgi:hypothetical protein